MTSIANLSPPQIIEKKRNGLEFTKEEIQYFVDGSVNGGMQPEQIGAMLMATYLKGLTEAETVALTEAMMRSGDLLQWPQEWVDQKLIVDKHSTGGVGDKVSLPLAPALAACGLKVPMISGRGLGFSGGTLDKLESIKGFNVYQSTENILKIMEEVGCCIVGQTQNMVPADKVLYATRDITATVNDMSLIVASIMSKKAAEQPNSLVLDVKYGEASFMGSVEKAKQLAEFMVKVGEGLGIRTTSLLSSMEDPLGMMVGNSLEVIEAVQCLHNSGPENLRELVTKCGAQLLLSTGKVASQEEGIARLEQVLADGSALKKFEKMLLAQGSDPKTVNDLMNGNNSCLPTAKHKSPLECPQSGYVKQIRAMECAMVCFHLGSGRKSAGQAIDHSVGLELCVQPGDKVEKDQVWVYVHHNGNLTEDFINNLQKSLILSTEKVEKRLLVREILTGH